MTMHLRIPEHVAYKACTALNNDIPRQGRVLLATDQMPSIDWQPPSCLPGRCFVPACLRSFGGEPGFRTIWPARMPVFRCLGVCPSLPEMWTLAACQTGRLPEGPSNRTRLLLHPALSWAPDSSKTLLWPGKWASRLLPHATVLHPSHVMSWCAAVRTILTTSVDRWSSCNLGSSLGRLWEGMRLLRGSEWIQFLSGLLPHRPAAANSGWLSGSNIRRGRRHHRRHVGIRFDVPDARSDLGFREITRRCSVDKSVVFLSQCPMCSSTVASGMHAAEPHLQKLLNRPKMHKSTSCIEKKAIRHPARESPEVQANLVGRRCTNNHGILSQPG